MKTPMPLHFAGLALTLLAISPTLHAQSTPAAPPASVSAKPEVISIDSEPGLKAFLDAYVAANNAKDIAKLKAMRPPQDLAAWTAFLEHQPAAPGQTKPTLEQSLLQPPIPEDHPPFVVKRYAQDAPAPSAGMIDWAVPPTHHVELTVRPDPKNIRSWDFELVRIDKDWFVVSGVPSADFLKKMTQKKSP